MKNQIKNRVLVVALAAVLATGCTTMNQQTGQQETSVGQTSAVGAGIGAAVGALIGGGKGALIGAALGGGAGFLVGLNAQKNELEAAKVAAAEIARETSLRPVVREQGYVNVNNGEKAQGLKSVDMDLPLKEMVAKNGELNDKGKAAMVKLQAVADRTGSLDLILPADMSARTFVSMTQTVPRAKISVTEGRIATARINGKQLDPNSGIKAVTV